MPRHGRSNLSRLSRNAIRQRNIASQLSDEEREERRVIMERRRALIRASQTQKQREAARETARVNNNNKNKHQQRYRERNRGTLKQREAERRKRMESLQSVAGPSTFLNKTADELNSEEITLAQRNEQGTEINAFQIRRDRQQKYREKNGGKLKQSEADKTSCLQNAELYTSPIIENREIMIEPILTDEMEIKIEPAEEIQELDYKYMVKSEPFCDVLLEKASISTDDNFIGTNVEIKLEPLEDSCIYDSLPQSSECLQEHPTQQQQTAYNSTCYDASMQIKTEEDDSQTTEDKFDAVNFNNEPFTSEGERLPNSIPKAFKSKYDSESHTRKVNTAQRLFQCNVCSEVFTTKFAFTSHLNVQTGEKMFKCCSCGIAFKTRVGLNFHIMVHTGEKPLQCQICSKSFKTKFGLKCHIRVHTGEKPFKCGICFKAYNTKSSINKHMITHSSEEPFKCDICHKVLKTKKGLNYHIMLHTFNASSTKIGFNKRVMIHTGEKLFKCDICPKVFKTKFDKNCHLRVHTGERPYKCDICSKAFITNYDFNKHKMILVKSRSNVTFDRNLLKVKCLNCFTGVPVKSSQTKPELSCTL